MHINSFVLFHVSGMITIEYLSCSLLQLMKAPPVNGILGTGSELSRCLYAFYFLKCFLRGAF